MSEWRDGGDTAWEAAYRHCPPAIRKLARLVKSECLTGGFVKEPSIVGFGGVVYELYRNGMVEYVGSTTSLRRLKRWKKKGFSVFVLPFRFDSEAEMRNVETYFIHCYKRIGVPIRNKRNAFPGR